MEARILVNRQGQIISAVLGRRPAEVEGGPPVPNMGPIVAEGHEVIELGLPDEYERQPLSAVIEKITAELKERPRASR